MCALGWVEGTGQEAGKGQKSIQEDLGPGIRSISENNCLTLLGA